MKNQHPVEFDTTDPKLGENLFESLNQLHDTCRVAWSTAHNGFWALSRYADLTRAALDTGLSPRRTGL